MRTASVAEVLDGGAQERLPVLQPPRPAEQLEQPQTRRECDRGERDRRPGERRTRQHGPAQEQQGDHRRRHQAAPQIVENLPARDQRQPVALRTVRRRHERKEPPQDLPVAAYPAVLAPRVREDARRVVVDDLDVGDQGRPRIEAFEEIVRQQRVLRHPALERRGERVDIVEALAGENAFVEQVLVDVGHGGRVRVDAGVAGVGPREQRARRARHRDADARLQDPVALGDAADPGVERADGSADAR